MNEDLNWLSGRSQSLSDYSILGREAHQHFENVKTSKSGQECRIINPAIYSESLNTIDDALPSTYSIKEPPRIEAQCGDFATLPIRISNLQLEDNENGVCMEPGETYRCQAMDFTSFFTSSSVDTSEERSGSSTKVERRCKIFDVPEQPGSDETLNSTTNNGRIVCALTTSMSCSSISDNHKKITNIVSSSRQKEHEKWLKEKLLKKKEDIRLAEQKKKEEEERSIKEKDEKEKRDKELFLAWSKRKEKEEAEKKKALEKEMELKQRLSAVEDTASAAKTIVMKEWVRRKGEELKAKEKQKRKLEKVAEKEKQERVEKSVKAYMSWKEKSKNTPKPSTQGVLPHQRAKPSYVNPNTWKSIIDEDAQDNE